MLPVNMAYLHSSLSEIHSLSQVFPGEHVRIVGLLKYLLQFPQLVASECCSITPLFLHLIRIIACNHVRYIIISGNDQLLYIL